MKLWQEGSFFRYDPVETRGGVKNFLGRGANFLGGGGQEISRGGKPFYTPIRKSNRYFYRGGGGAWPNYKRDLNY